MTDAIIRLDQIETDRTALVGGKAANLAELGRIERVAVPDGFCVTTAAFDRVVAAHPELRRLIDHVARPGNDAGAAAAEIRSIIEQVPLPSDIETEIAEAIDQSPDVTWAVRSSATAEDAPTSSFAGQHASFLDVPAPAVVDHVRRCWASLFTDAAIAYRERHGISHARAQMAVVVQHMLAPAASGVLFTADPVTSDRTVVAIEAVLGLADALVSGLVTAASYRVRGSELLDAPGDTDRRALTDEQAIELAVLARRIEAHFGTPQDIEWCLVDGGYWIVQSRPITTLFPVPQVDDGRNHIYLSVGHQQMMTEAIKPLGLSIWQMTAARPMDVAGGRLFVDVTDQLISPATRTGLLNVALRSDPLIRDALQSILDRDDFLPSPDPDAAPPAPPPGAGAPSTIETDPAVVSELIARTRESIDGLRRTIQTLHGDELFAFIERDIDDLKQSLFDPRSHAAILAGIEATWWLDDHLKEWLGEVGAADTLSQSAPHNITADMGLDLLDVADAIRPHPAVVDHLRHVAGDDFLDHLSTVDGGPQARAAIDAYLEAYGMRCVGEVDITRRRWRERPAALLPMILTHIDNTAPGEAERRREQGRQRARAKEAEVLERLRALPDGDTKAAQIKQMIERLRTFIGYREHPKYAMICRYDAYKQALDGEAQRLAETGVIDNPEDIYYLRFDELREIVRTGASDRDLIRRRKAEHQVHQRLTPPRVLTSDGEALSGAYRRDDLPAGALAGLAVSTGVAEGRARVVLDMVDAKLEPGDILVTPHTDPSWSPLFITAAGLVTEVGGLMTHGSVIAREYGLPAVVGVAHATKLIRNGERIRVDGTNGHVTVLTAR